MANHVFMAEYFLKEMALIEKFILLHTVELLQILYKCLTKDMQSGVPGMMTKSGHFMAIVGYSEVRKSLLMHDPYKRFDFEKQLTQKNLGLMSIIRLTDL